MKRCRHNYITPGWCPTCRDEKIYKMTQAKDKHPLYVFYKSRKIRARFLVSLSLVTMFLSAYPYLHLKYKLALLIIGLIAALEYNVYYRRRS